MHTHVERNGEYLTNPATRPHPNVSWCIAEEIGDISMSHMYALWGTGGAFRDEWSATGSKKKGIDLPEV